MENRGFLGMDIHQVRELSGQLAQAASTVDAAIGKLSETLEAVPWQGPDADKFRTEWRGARVAQLKKVVTDLSEAASQTSKHASEQERVSGH